MERTPWFKHYDKGVPYSLAPYPQCTLLDCVTNSFRQRPNHPALLFKGKQISYAELEQLSNIFAAALIEQGVKKGEHVLMLLPNCPQSIISQLGIWKAGAVAVPLNPLYTEHELEHLLTDCSAETAVVLTPYYSKIKSLQPHTRLRRIIVTSIKEYLPLLPRLVFTLLKEKKEGHSITLQQDLWLCDLLRQHAGAPRPHVSVNPNDPALLLFTGGTTGTPKGVVGTHHSLLMAGMQLHAWFGIKLVDWDDVIMLIFPLFHVAGNVGVLATSLIGHNPLVIVPDPSNINDLVATIHKVRPAIFSGVPTLFIALLNHPDVKAGKVDFRSIKLCISGASQLRVETKERFEAVTGVRMVEAYALTESMMAAVIGPVHGAYKVNAVGMPLPDVDIRIADMDTGQGSLPFGEIGEILIRAPQIMQSYWHNPSETDSIVRNGWLHSGDLGYLDEDGYLFIIDRKKDMIKSSGFQVWPREVEDVIISHPAVAEVGVAGIQNNYQHEAVKAWVVLRPGHQVTADEIKDYCHERLTPYKVPKYIEFRDSLPKTIFGKVMRHTLVRGIKNPSLFEGEDGYS